VARLLRDALALGLAFEPGLARRAFAELARAAFGPGEGIVRLEARRTPNGATQLVAHARGLGPEPDTWHAGLAREVHPGTWPGAPGAKLAGRTSLVRAREEAAARLWQEGLLLDATGRLVEGTRSNLAVQDVGGPARTPPLSRGAVAGVAREILLGCGALHEGDVSRDELARASEVVALSSVRGARAIVRIGERRVGDGRTGELARRLDAVLASAD
jgi:branched-subunit amino acid aminotransferase/4-amino-4-deoxychorismate lyase